MITSLTIAILVTLGLIVGTHYAPVDAQNNHCFTNGFLDGQNHPFSQDAFKHCGATYQDGFRSGCLLVKGNTEAVCESAQDG